MKVLTTEFKEFCQNKFGDLDGDKVYYFYKSLDKRKTSNDKNTGLLQRRMKSILYLLENYNSESILDTIDIFEQKRKSGSFIVDTIAYFTKCVENHFNSKKTIKDPKSNPLFNQQTKDTSSIEPIQLRRLDSVIDIEALNWIYSCSNCKEEFDGYSEICPNCKRIIDWKKVVIKNV
jgi:hypothetical protein